MRADKLYLVGFMGAGKSTVLRIIAGEEPPTQGGVHLARGRSVAYLAQEARFSGTRTLRQEMDAALAHLTTLQQEISELEHALADTNAPDWEQRMERYGELTQRFEAAYSAKYGYRQAGAAVEAVDWYLVASITNPAAGVNRTQSWRSQTAVSARRGTRPSYELVASKGPAHAQQFTVEVLVGADRLATGSGSSRQRAEEHAAQAALEHLPEVGA